MRILIKNGTVIDGTGAPGVIQDLWIEGDRIKRIGQFERLRADCEINAKGLVVAPGFIDSLNHSDVYLTLFEYPHQESLAYQGVTTIIGGMCGSSLAPLVRVGVLASIQKWADIRDFTVNWARFGEFLDTVAKRKIGVNFASLVGHSTLRRGLVGDDFRALDANETKQMHYLLEGALAEGAFGFSSGLAYSHAKVAASEEIVELLKLVKKYDGIYSTHIRGESDELLFALEEAIASAREADVPLDIAHFKAMGKESWRMFRDGVAMIEDARAGGMPVTFNMYPYTVTGSVLYTLLPDWMASGGRAKMLERLRDPAVRAKAASEMQQAGAYPYDKVKIALFHGDPMSVGRTVAEIAQNQGVSPEEAVMDILVAAQGRVTAFMEVVSEQNVKLGIMHSASHVASDGAGYATTHKKTKNLVHPRSFGAFIRAINLYARGRLMPLEAMIAKMTSGPARTYGIHERGEIREGYFADIAILRPRAVKDTATFDNPYRYSEGVEHLIVNGKIVIKKKQHTGVMAGAVLRKR